MLVFLLAVAASAAETAQQSQVTPIQKVIQMLNDMLAKATAEKEDEQVRFASYKQFCESTSKEKKKSENAEHAAVDQYLKDLEPACGVGDSSYGDRKQARADEITALRKAQNILTEAFRAKGFLQK